VPSRKGGGNVLGNDSDFMEHLKQHLILGVAGGSFGKPGWVRFAYCVEEQRIRASAGAFKRAMESWVS
jgi:aspartate aminotransferase